MLSELHLKLPESTVERRGLIVKAVGTSLRATGLSAQIGQRVLISSGGEESSVYADVVGLEQDQLMLYPLGSIEGITAGASVRLLPGGHKQLFSANLLGGVYDGLGNCLHHRSPPENAAKKSQYLPLSAKAPCPMSRLPVDKVFCTGIKAIDSLLTVGIGQRMGIFAPAGVGKSTLLSMLSRFSQADVVVVALIGERGREVKEFLNENLTQDQIKRTVVVVATSDRPAMERVLAARSATSIAEGFRAQGKNVLLLMDSVTRYARALREIGLSVGEPPVRRGFPPSVFADLPNLFERVGNNDRGSITAFYTVLTEDADSLDPIAEETLSILDGHIILSRKLAESGVYPAIDVLSSASRLFLSLTSPTHRAAAIRLRQMMSKYDDIEFLVQVGEYQKGSDGLADQAIEKQDLIREFLAQDHQVSEEFDHSVEKLEAMTA